MAKSFSFNKRNLLRGMRRIERIGTVLWLVIDWLLYYTGFAPTMARKDTLQRYPLKAPQDIHIRHVQAVCKHKQAKAIHESINALTDLVIQKTKIAKQHDKNTTAR
jgi:hypothetical protein